MYHLHQSDNLDTLLQDGLPIIRPHFDDQQTLYVIQSTVMQRWFKFRLASLSGVSAIPPLLVPDQSMRLLLSKMATKQPEALFLDDLILGVHQELQKIARQIGKADQQGQRLAAIYAPVLNYLGFENQAELQRDTQAGLMFDLANELAGVLFSYAQNPVDDQSGNELLKLWSTPDQPHYLCDRLAQISGLSTDNAFLSRLRQHEVWQADLFLRLFPATSEHHGILGLLMQRAISQQWVYHGPYKRVILFGSAFLSRRAFDFVHYLSKSLDVYHFLFRPGLGAHQDSLSHQWSRLARDLDHQLLASIKKQETVVLSSHSHDLVTSLSALQTAYKDASDLERVRHLVNQDSGQANNLQLLGDNSFVVIESSTPFRQVEGLFQRLLARLEDQDPSKKLALEDILVMAPEIQSYRAAIEAIFGPAGPRRSAAHDPQTLHLGWNMADLGFGAASPWLKASRTLFDLANSRWERSLLGALIGNPCFYRKHGFAPGDQETLLRFIEKANIRWGYDGKQRKTRGGGDKQEQTWFSAFRRFCEDYPYAPSEDQGSLSGFDQSKAQLIGKLFAILDQIYTGFEDFKSHPRTLDQWVDQCLALIEQNIAILDDDDKHHQSAVLSTMFQLKHLVRNNALADPQAELDWFTFWHFFNDQLDQVEGGLGQRMASGITFSSVKPYRAVRFKLIVMLGCNEADFPRRNQWQSFDLGILGNLSVLPDFAHEEVNFGHRPLGGRLAAEVQDSWAWLETIYSAAQALWLYYQAVDPYSGKSKLASPFLTSLLDLLDSGSRGRIVQSDGLHGYDLTAKTRPDSLRSSRFIERARALAGPRLPALTQRALAINELQPGQTLISLSDLSSVFMYPLDGFARYRLQLSLKTKRDILSNDQENMALDFWDGQAWLKSLMLECLMPGNNKVPTLRSFDQHDFIERKLAAAHRSQAITASSFDFIAEQDLQRQASILSARMATVVAQLGLGQLDLVRLVPIEPLGLVSTTFLVDASSAIVFQNPRGERFLFSMVNRDLKNPLAKDGTCNLGAEDLLGLYLPLVLLDALWPSETVSQHILVSAKVDSYKDYYRVSSSEQSKQLKSNLEEALVKLLSEPQAIYLDFLDKKDHSIRWQDWWQLALDEQVFIPGGLSKLKPKSSKPASCAWLPLFFPDGTPQPSAIFDDLVGNFYAKVLEMAREALVASAKEPSNTKQSNAEQQASQDGEQT